MLKKFLLSALALFMTLCPAKLWAYDFSDDSTGTTLYYNILSESESTVEVTYPNSSRPSSSKSEYSETSYIIPETVSYGGATYTVVAISEAAFYWCNLTSMVIGDNVTTIGEYAFDYCTSLTSLTIGKNMTEIGVAAFYECKALTSVKIPASVTSIGRNAFGRCSALEEIVVDEENQYYSSDDYGVLFNKDKTTLLCCPAGSQTYTIPESVTTVEDYAFYMCQKLTSITIGENVTIIGDKAFYYCTNLEGDLIIPDKVTSIGYEAFYDCYKLTSVTFGSSVTTIGESAFWYCTGLTSATFGNSVETIERAAFYECESLTTITLGSSVKTIGESAFYYCSGLTSITTLNPTPPDCGSYAFNRINTANITLYVPKGCSSVYSSTSPWSDFGTIEELPAVGDKIYVDGLYYNILSDTEAEVTYNTDDDGAIIPYTQETIVIPSSITRGLTYNVVGAGYWAFYGCENLTSIDLGSITYIGEQAFRDCVSLSSIELPESLTNIGDYAFSGCSGLTGELVIPDNVVTLGNDAFTGCSELTAVVIGSGVETIGDSAFQFCDNLMSVTFGENVVSIGGTAFASTALEGDLVIPDKVTTIGDWAFSGCSHLTSLTLGTGLETIGGSAFSSCEGLTSVTSLNTTPPTCGEGVFSYIDVSIIPLYVPVGTAEDYATTEVWEDFGHIIEMTSFAIATLPATDVTVNSATLNGSLTPAYDDPLLEAGFEYWAEGSDDVTIVAADDMTVSITGLDESTTYVYRAYAITEGVEIAYGNEESFTTLADTSSGISAISLDSDDIEAIYSVDGRQLSAPQRGINIVRLKDGTTNKVYIK